MKLTKQQAQLVAALCKAKIAEMARHYPPFHKLPHEVAYRLSELKYNLTTLQVVCEDFTDKHDKQLEKYIKRRSKMK